MPLGGIMNLGKKAILLLLALFGFFLMIMKVLESPIFPYTMVLFMAVVISIAIKNYRGKPSRSGFIKIAAYLCATIADIFLNFTPYAKVHIFLFLVVQILLFTAYLSDIPFKRRDLVSLTVPVVVSLILYSIIVIPVLPHPLGAAFAVYLICLTLMVWRAFCFLKAEQLQNKQKWMLFIGSVCFYCTDILVGVRIIYNPGLINLWVYLVYPPALFLIATSDWHRRKKAPGISRAL